MEFLQAEKAGAGTDKDSCDFLYAKKLGGGNH
jgi:hypothetical protein